MRDLRYKIFPIGSRGVWKRGTVADLLNDLPYWPFGDSHAVARFPDCETLNRFLLRGVLDAGMSGGCEWKPFTTSEAKYQEIRLEMLTMPRCRYQIEE